MKDEEWHPAQQASMADDGSLMLNVPYAHATESAMDVLRHGEHVRVLSPAKLAQIVTANGRVGLKGTARISGHFVPLGYWMLRRPIAYLRQTLGW